MKYNLSVGNLYLELFSLYYWDEARSEILQCQIGKSPFPLGYSHLHSKELVQEIIEAVSNTTSGLVEEDFGGETTYMGKISYLRHKYDIGLKAAKELVDKPVRPEVRKAWPLPTGLEFEHYFPKEYISFSYVEDWGVIPNTLLSQPQLEGVIEFQAVLTQELLCASTFEVSEYGLITGIAPLTKDYVASYKYYKNHTDFSIHKVNQSRTDLIGTYSSLLEAQSHYAAFRAGMAKAEAQWKGKLRELID